jgi:NAD(P)-dependent dehydrogenase (short-subunit alcohol dehydrogenase family)
MSRLQGKVVIVTGASTGMGRAIALALAAEAATLAIVARNAQRLEETAAAARAHGARVLAFPADVGSPARVKAVVQDVIGRLGRVDVLVNNAGTNTFHRNLADTSAADWDLVLGTNLRGAFLFAREVLPHMRAAGKGLVINISSGAGLQPSAPAGVAYSASKHGLQALTGSINAEYRRHGVRACAIAPGETDTPNLDLRPLPPSAEARATMLTPEDIANAVLYVATQPDSVAVDLLVITPTLRRNYQADYERYIAEGHTDQRAD